MAILQDIEVRVVSNTTHQALPEYNKPNSTVVADGHSLVKYIEAKTGEDFQIEVFIKKGFEFLRAWGITVSLKLMETLSVIANPTANHASSIKELQRSGEPLVFDSVGHLENSVYSKIGFRFGSLSLSKSYLHLGVL